MAQIEYIDLSEYVKDALDEAVIAALYAAGSELLSQTQRRTRPREKDGYDVKGTWELAVDEDEMKARVGNPLEAVYWEEFGTGEYALNKDGRQGWWVYVEGQSKHPSSQVIRTEKQAKAIAASMRKEGLPAHATNGKEPNRPLYRAFAEEKAKIARVFESTIKERMGGE